MLIESPIRSGQSVVFPFGEKFKHFGYYLTMIGASAALGDLDGDGLPNDLCITDVRAKSITVGPVPGTGNRYPTFSLDFGPGFDRRTAHPSVCRVFDIGESEGRIFLTMEYIDGEDLQSLLRRIGRLPADKAVEVITSSARTGQIGDGKIFVTPIDHALRIRTGETDTDAL